MTILQRVWVLANLAEDEKFVAEQERRKYDLLLAFIDNEMYKRYEDIKAGRLPKLTGEGEVDQGPADSEFLADVESLPSRRAIKPPMVDEYIKKRMLELAGKLEAKGIEVASNTPPPKPGEKTLTYERKVLRKNNG